MKEESLRTDDDYRRDAPTDFDPTDGIGDLVWQKNHKNCLE